MGWLKLDDQFPINAKTRSLSIEARYLYITSLCWCAMQMNDGLFLASDVQTVAALAGVQMPVAEHLYPALWHREGTMCEPCTEAGQVSPVPSGHVAVHCYLERNESRAQQEERRRKDRERKASRLGGKSSASHPDSGRNPPTGSRRIPPVSSSPVLEGFSSSSSSSDSRSNGHAVDDDDQLSTRSPVPDEVWDCYAERMLAKQPANSVKWPVKWKRRTADNARDDLADQAERWWSTFVVDPDRLAGWLIDGTPSPHAEHRPGAPT